MTKSPPYRQTIPIWWSMFWRNSVFGFLAAGIAVFFAGIVAGWSGFSGNTTLLVAAVGFLAGVPVSFWAFRQALIKHGLGLHSEPLDEIFE
ncbi:MAG: hypothetical protein ABJP02_08550 [Parasphingorhabdus sp.]|uniref:hypothetical protein n=1 Tax=Parasphingorhabdus sp. TaxID=2709688 RepID=UPI003298AA41